MFKDTSVATILKKGAHTSSQKLIMRRSIFSTKNLMKGHTLNKNDLVLKRPGTGTPANKYSKFVTYCNVNDMTSGFRVYSDHALESIDFCNNFWKYPNSNYH